MPRVNEIDWKATYLNYTQNGLGAIDPDSFIQLKLELLDSWIDLASDVGLEPAIRLLKDDSLRKVLLPELKNWDELVSKLDTRQCAQTFTLANIFRWFLWLQLACIATWITFGLVMFCRKFLIFRAEWKKNRLFLVVDKPRYTEKEEFKTDRRESQTSLKQAYTVLHVKNVESEWLPDRLRSMLKKEDKKARLNREMINEFRRKLLASHKNFKKTMDPTVKPGFSIEENQQQGHCAGALKKWFKIWCSGKKFKENTTPKDRTKRELIKFVKKKRIALRKVESAIFAHQYEKERGAFNQHLVPSEDQSKSDLCETQSMWDMQK